MAKTKKTKPAASTEAEESIVKPSTPLVFISHDTRDAEIAEAFSVATKAPDWCDPCNVIPLGFEP